MSLHYIAGLISVCVAITIPLVSDLVAKVGDVVAQATTKEPSFGSPGRYCNYPVIGESVRSVQRRILPEGLFYSSKDAPKTSEKQPEYTEITHIHKNATLTIYFRNDRVEVIAIKPDEGIRARDVTADILQACGACYQLKKTKSDSWIDESTKVHMLGYDDQVILLSDYAYERAKN